MVSDKGVSRDEYLDTEYSEIVKNNTYHNSNVESVLDNNIPTMGFCRGMQMLSVVSGAEIIQDIPVFFEENNIPYDYEHRNQKATPDSYRDYAPHNIEIIDKDSHIYDIFSANIVESVPSWHHQAVKSVEGTKLKVTSVLDTNGYDIIESVERTDKDFIVGYQFHPEAAVVKNINNISNAGDYMDMDTAMKTFVYFIEYIECPEEEQDAA